MKSPRTPLALLATFALSLGAPVASSLAAQSVGLAAHADVAPSSDHPDAIILSEPADEWETAFPVGNGRLAAMVFGRPGEELIQVNEESVWEGSPQRNAVREGAREALRRITNLILEGKPREAEQVSMDSQPGAAADVLSYQTLGDIRIRDDLGTDVASYHRYLDLRSGAAVSEIVYAEGGAMRQTVFASGPAEAVIVHVALSGRKSEPARFEIGMKRPDGPVALASDDHLHMAFALRSNGPGGTFGNAVSARLAAFAPQGDVTIGEDSISVETSDEFWLILTADTEFHGDDPAARTLAILRAAGSSSAGVLYASHAAEHRALFDNFDLQLGEKVTGRNTAERIAAVKAGASDPDLYRLFTQFGRYLLISSSRPGSLPANLQGKWNDYIAAPWNSDYHMNINLQMNYWGAEQAGLASSHEALLKWIEQLARNGEATAREQYGARGWVAHHTSDAYARTVPDRAIWGHWPLGGAWTALAFAERYRFSQDPQDAVRGYAVLRGSALFALDLLLAVPEGLPFAGRLAPVPSQSPENRYLTDEGKPAVLTYGSTGDIQIIREVFDSALELLEAVRRDRGDPTFDAAFEAEIRASRERLVPMQISERDGRLMEWIENYEEAEPGHRHISHAFALHPADEISPDRTPQLAAALRKTIDARLANGGGGTGWSRAWLANMFARLHEGDAALEQLSVLVARASQPNLLTTHPPFQIDGNLGGMAAVTEMLLQSHLGEIHLLPALPTAWSSGEVRGMRARGGFVVDMTWAEGALVEGEVTATRDTPARLRSRLPLDVSDMAGEPVATSVAQYGDDWVTSFVAQAGEAYRLVPTELPTP